MIMIIEAVKSRKMKNKIIRSRLSLEAVVWYCQEILVQIIFQIVGKIMKIISKTS